MKPMSGAKTGLDFVIVVFETPFYWLGFVVGLVVNVVKYGYFVGSTYGED